MEASDASGRTSLVHETNGSNCKLQRQVKHYDAESESG
jgi:hypothetical protein